MNRIDTDGPAGGDTPDAATAGAWSAVGGSEDLLDRVSYEPAGDVLPSRLPVREMARATVGVCSLAAAELLALRNGGPVPSVRVHEGAVATAFVSERHLRAGGRPLTLFAPLSGFWRTADGWVRTHANYPHHRARLLAALGIPDSGDDEALSRAVAAELAAREALEAEEAVYAAGGLAVIAMPTPSPVVQPLLETGIVNGSPRELPAAALPAQGVRVLDLTRVIAGPVATRTLALLGADVLRVDSPRLPESEDAHLDTGMGKRSTLLDLEAPEDRRVFDGLLDQADVVVTGYRPGALDRYGLSAEALLTRRRDLIVGQLNAWGWGGGPWSDRRGFDSLVQAAYGIAAVEASEDGQPGVLPAQALDHGTGYLLAAAVLRSLAERQTTGGGRLLRLSLAGTAAWLMHTVPRTAAPDGPAGGPEPWLSSADSPYGRLRHALPPVAYEGSPGNWSRPPGRWGADAPAWR